VGPGPANPTSPLKGCYASGCRFQAGPIEANERKSQWTVISALFYWATMSQKAVVQLEQENSLALLTRALRGRELTRKAMMLRHTGAAV
jgi:hypothetical protein